MEEAEELPKAKQEEVEKELVVVSRSLPFPSPPSSNDADAISGGLEKIALDETLTDKPEVVAEAFGTEEKREEKSEVEGVPGGEKEGLAGKADAENVLVTPKDEEPEIQRIPYPQRPGSLDCAYYLRTGICAYGANCKFNHPPKKRSIQMRPRDSSESVQEPVSKEEREELPEKGGQIECKFFLTPGGCKFGNACRFGHCQEKADVLGMKLNFLGLPIRPGIKECPYYMRTGGCKFSSNCWFNHPDPAVVTAEDHVLGFQNDGSPKEHATVETNLPASHFHRNSGQTVSNSDCLPSYVPSLHLPLNGFDLNPNSRTQVPSSASFPLGSNIQQPSFTAAVGDTRTIHQQADMGYPERPGQPECTYFMKTGDCKFRWACKFHHPRCRLTAASTCNISPLGLPLRPDKPVCAFYGRFGICKFGPACKFDHPMDFASSESAVARAGDASDGEDTAREEVKVPGSNTLVRQST